MCTHTCHKSCCTHKFAKICWIMCVSRALFKRITFSFVSKLDLHSFFQVEENIGSKYKIIVKDNGAFDPLFWLTTYLLKGRYNNLIAAKTPLHKKKLLFCFFSEKNLLDWILYFTCFQLDMMKLKSQGLKKKKSFNNDTFFSPFCNEEILALDMKGRNISIRHEALYVNVTIKIRNGDKFCNSSLDIDRGVLATLSFQYFSKYSLLC